MTTQHIGAAGELLVQYQLLKHDIDSARLTTDSGIDLAAYSPSTSRAVTIQVKSVLKPTTAGGIKGAAPTVGWWFPSALKADLLATVLLDTDTVWLFTRHEALDWARQHNARGNCQLYWYLDEARVSANGWHASVMDYFKLDNRVRDLLLGEPATGQRPVRPGSGNR